MKKTLEVDLQTSVPGAAGEERPHLKRDTVKVLSVDDLRKIAGGQVTQSKEGNCAVPAL